MEKITETDNELKNRKLSKNGLLVRNVFKSSSANKAEIKKEKNE